VGLKDQLAGEKKSKSKDDKTGRLLPRHSHPKRITPKAIIARLWARVV